MDASAECAALAPSSDKVPRPVVRRLSSKLLSQKALRQPQNNLLT